ncbi:MAG: molybdenum cofactor biosynthesis protein, partial [Planctomycetes bacterium]|nr:molybdenum cofactor biosynthesis protein [Planctomycetota bacterium]
MTSDASETSFRDHERAASGVGPLGFAVITLSDTRTPETDRSGQWIREAVVQAGHAVVRYRIVRDETETIRAELEAALADPAVAVVVTN